MEKAIERAKAGGYRVVEDSDQRGLWVWLRDDGNGAPEGCNCSYSSEKEAWRDAAREAMSVAMAAADLSDSDWNGMSHAAQLAAIRAAHGLTPDSES